MQLRVFKYAAIAALGGFVFGLDAAVISGTIKFITTEFDLTDIQIGAVVSASGFGVIFALLLAGYFADKWGRKKTLLLIASLYLVSAIGSAMAQSFYQLVAARLIGGLAFTSLSLATMYIGEISPPNIRGKLVAMNQVNIVIGLSAAYFINFLLLQASNTPTDWVVKLGIHQNTWRWMLGSEIVPAITWFALLYSIPQSPRWLVLKGRIQDAQAVLSKIRPPHQVDTELAHIQQSLTLSKASHSLKTQLSMLLGPEFRIAFWIGLTFAIVQQLTGINAILFYAPTVFEQLGIGTNAAFMQAVFVGIISLIFSSLAILFIDRIGRRTMTIWGLLWAVISLGICAYGFHQATYTLTENRVKKIDSIENIDQLQEIYGVTYTSDVAFKNALTAQLGETVVRDQGSLLIQSSANIPVNLILVGILSFIAAFQFSIGPIMWVVFSEIISTQVRGAAIPTFALATSIVSYLIQQFFPWQLTHMGSRDIFLFYALTSAAGLFVLFQLLPETKNRSIEEIEASLKAKSHKLKPIRLSTFFQR